MRLIDADSFLTREIKRCHCVPSVGSGEKDYESLKWQLQQEPTVDAAPVVHGRWVPLPSMAPEYACSVCERDYTWGELEEAPYCPNCGAKMDGGNENG